MHGSHVAQALQVEIPGVQLSGLGGPKMADAGVQLFHGLDQLAVMGFVEVLGRIRFFRKLEKDLVSRMESGEYDLILPIDYPGLNLRLTKHAAKLGLPVLFYISPQVWAWKGHRAGALARDAARIAVILPFEVPIYEELSGRVEFVGHPLLDEIGDLIDNPEAKARARHELCVELGLDPDRPVLALFPGSRAQELHRHSEPFAAVAERVLELLPETQVVVGKAPSLGMEHYQRFPFPISEEGHTLLLGADAGLVKSGTSTVEAALLGIPFAVAYVTHPATWWLAQRLVKVPSVALANLVAGTNVVPEYLQNDVTPDLVAPVLVDLLDHRSERRRTVMEGLKVVRERLGSPGAARRVAQMAREVLAEHEGSAS